MKSDTMNMLFVAIFPLKLKKLLYLDSFKQIISILDIKNHV